MNGVLEEEYRTQGNQEFTQNFLVESLGKDQF
jgi:hypothetical protein